MSHERRGRVPMGASIVDGLGSPWPQEELDRCCQWAEETGADLAKVNRNGSAIVIGQPLGSSGTKSMATTA